MLFLNQSSTECHAQMFCESVIREDVVIKVYLELLGCQLVIPVEACGLCFVCAGLVNKNSFLE